MELHNCVFQTYLKTFYTFTPLNVLHWKMYILKSDTPDRVFDNLNFFIHTCMNRFCIIGVHVLICKFTHLFLECMNNWKICFGPKDRPKA